VERHRNGLIALALALAVGCASADGSKRPDDNDEPRAHVLVQVTESSLEPAVARVLQGGDVEWGNYASHLAGVVIFPAGIADDFTCHDLDPRFSKVALGYQSAFITAGGGTLDLPCPLKPGTYTYELRLFDADFASPEDPLFTLKGTIDVE
jgi:hypothetical protein